MVHVNHPVIVPVPLTDNKFSVAIARGILNSGNPYTLVLDYVAHDLSLTDAVSVARAVMHLEQLHPRQYSEPEAQPPYLEKKLLQREEG